MACCGFFSRFGTIAGAAIEGTEKSLSIMESHTLIPKKAPMVSRTFCSSGSQTDSPSQRDVRTASKDYTIPRMNGGINIIVGNDEQLRASILIDVLRKLQKK